MTGMDDDLERRDDERSSAETATDDLERASENVLEGWPNPSLDDPPEDAPIEDGPGGPEDASVVVAEPTAERLSRATSR